MAPYRALWEALPEPVPAACWEHGLAAIRRGRAALIPLTLLGVLAAVVGASLSRSLAGALGGLAFALFVTAPFQAGFAYVCLRAARGVPTAPRHALKALDNYREAVASTALVWLGTTLGLACFVAPGVVFYCRTRFVPYLVVEEGLDAAAAIQESFRLTRGHEAAILGVTALGLAACGVGLLLFGVGVVPALVWWDAALASLYHAVVLPSEAWDPESRLMRPLARA